MVVQRLILVFLILGMLGLALGATPASACHRSSDLCLPCQGSDGSCELTGDIDTVGVVGQIRDYVFPEPAEEDMHFSSRFDADERRGYIALHFEWATDDHTAPPGQANVPITIEFTPDEEIDWDGSTQETFTFTVNDTSEVRYFAFTAPREDVDVRVRVVANPGTANEDVLEGTMTLEEYGGDAHGHSWSWALMMYWPMWLLVLIIGLAVGALVGMRRTP